MLLKKLSKNNNDNLNNDQWQLFNNMEYTQVNTMLS